MLDAGEAYSTLLDDLASHCADRRTFILLCVWVLSEIAIDLVVLRLSDLKGTRNHLQNHGAQL